MSGIKGNTEVASTDESNTEVAKDIPLITVSKLQENEDGSCDLEVNTNPEATRMLVDIGLNALLEKALDKNNDEYTLKNGLHE